MKSVFKSRQNAFLLTAVFIASATGQNLAPAASIKTGSISGVVRDENDTAIQAEVTVATQGFSQEALTLADGTFKFPAVKPGIYIVCAVARTTVESLVDSCLWQDSSTQRVPIVGGESREGVLVRLEHGHAVNVRVNDPRRLLGSVNGKIGARELSVHIVGRSGLVQPMPVVTRDSNGQVHSIIVPFDIPHTVVIHSSTLVLTSGKAKELETFSSEKILASRGDPQSNLVINIDRVK